MSRRPRRNHSPAFKSKVALAPVKGEQTITELSQKLDVHPYQITQWESQLSAIMARAGLKRLRAGRE